MPLMSISWKASLPISAPGTLPVIATIGTESSSAVPMPGDEVRRARARCAHAHADPAGDPGVAVGGVRAALLVADEDVAQLRVVAEDVVERQDHAARIAEEDVDPLAQQGLAQDVRPDARPLEVARLVEHALAGALDRERLRRPVVRARGCAVAGDAPDSVASTVSLFAIVIDRVLRGAFVRTNERPSPPGEGPWVCRWCRALRALVPPRLLGLRREPVISPRRPSSPGSERRSSRRDTSERPAGSMGTWMRRPSVVTTTATLPTILSIEPTQSGLPVTRHRPGPDDVSRSLRGRSASCNPSPITLRHRPQTASISQSAPLLTRLGRSSGSVDGRSVGRPSR